MAGARRLTTERRLRNVYWLRAAVPQLAPVPTHDLVCAVDGLDDTADRRAGLRAIHAALAEDGLDLWSVPRLGRAWERACPGQGGRLLARRQAARR